MVHADLPHRRPFGRGARYVALAIGAATLAVASVAGLVAPAAFLSGRPHARSAGWIVSAAAHRGAVADCRARHAGKAHMVNSLTGAERPLPPVPGQPAHIALAEIADLTLITLDKRLAKALSPKCGIAAPYIAPAQTTVMGDTGLEVASGP
jgi:hypothetical protein